MTKRCSACHSTHVRRSGTYPGESHAHLFHSPYRCLDCDTRFWVVSRRTRAGAGAVGVLALAVILGFGVAKVVVETSDVRLASAARQIADRPSAGTNRDAPDVTPAGDFGLRAGSSELSAPTPYPALPARP